MIEGYVKVPVEHFGGWVTSWPPEMLDSQLLTEATNVRFTQAEVSVREGLSLAFATPSLQEARGLADYSQLDGTEQPVVLDAGGKLYVETPAGSGTLQSADPISDVTPPAGCWMNAASAFNRLYMGFSDGQVGTGTPASFDGTHVDPVTIAAPLGPSAAADAATAGNVAAGTRYGVVMYMTREGSLTAPGAPFQWTAAGGKQVTVSGLPIGPQQVEARVVAFTVAGGSSAGPYFYIGFSQTSNGVSETTTVVPGNVTTSATFNFDDDFLAASNDVSDQFRAIVLPNLAGVMFSQLTQRLLWWGDGAQPSAVYCSNPGDAGVYYGDTGFFQVEEGSGLRVTAVFELRNQLYVALERGLYLVTPNDGDPATWQVTRVSQSVGASGLRAVAVGSDFAFLVHEAGAYVFDGGQPTRVNDELLGPAHATPGAWEQIHWSRQQFIWAHIDHDEKCVRVGVPTQGSSECDTVYKVSYLDGWDPSLRFSSFTARYHYFPGRRWSRDTIAASQAVWVRRPLTLDGTPSDLRMSEAQILLAGAGGQGSVYYLDPDSAQDADSPIAWAVTTGAFSAAERTQQMRQGVEMVGLVQLRAQGSGTLRVEAVVGKASLPVGEVALGDGLEGSYSLLAMAQGEAVSMRLSGGGAAGLCPAQVAALYGFCRPTWTLWAGERS